MISYRDNAINTYGHRCELCSYQAVVEVHHIDYVGHQLLENKIRLAKKTNGDVAGLIQTANEAGYDTFEYNQLAKDDRTTNLAVLCPTCHSFIHVLDSGTNLLRALPIRK